MKLNIYDARVLDDHFQAVVKALTGIVAKGDIVQHRTLPGLLKSLGLNTWGEPVVIFTESDAALEEILTHAEKLSNWRIVLILHDDKETTFIKAHKLRPRILFVQPVAAETIAAVIARIVNRGRMNWNHMGKGQA